MFDIARIQTLLDRVESAILLIQSKVQQISTPDDFLLDKVTVRYIVAFHISRMPFSFSRTGYVPSLLFQVALIPPPKGKWGIRLPLRDFTGKRAKPGINQIGREGMTETYLMP